MSWKIRVRGLHLLNIRLTIIITLAAALASLAVYGMLLASLLFGFQEQDRAELDSRLLSYWAAWQYGGNEAVLERAAQDVKVHGGRPFLLIFNGQDGERLGALIPGGWEIFNLEHPALKMLFPGTYQTLREEGVSYSLLLTGAELDDGSRLLVGLSTENREFLLLVFQRTYPLAGAAIILAGIIVGIFASRRLLSPIESLNNEIDRIIVTGELGRRLERPGTGDQMDELIRRYNLLLDRVESLIDGMKETLDAVAHDLRSPLTRLRGHAELALRNGKVSDLKDALALVVEQTDQAGGLLSALMDIAEAEQGMLHLDGESCDLSVLVAEVCDMYSFIAEEKNQVLHLEASGPVPLMGDPIRLRQILGNLLDNAVKYSPEGSHIEIRCGITDGESWAEVVDQGPGVPEAEVDRVFDRLYRGDRSRGSRGLGLGLSMVKALVDAHNGRVTVSKGPKGLGARFRVTFPYIAPNMSN